LAGPPGIGFDTAANPMLDGFVAQAERSGRVSSGSDHSRRLQASKYREFLIPAWSDRASYASPRGTLGDSTIEVERLKKSLGSLLVLDR
jgi:hypothetical protein